MQNPLDAIAWAGVHPGEVVAGRYRIESVLGAGGMGVVVSAHHLQLDTKVAIKFLLPDMLQDPEAVERFQREARAAVKIANEHVARIFDVGTLESGAPYMVMEFLEGGDLSSWIKQKGPLPVDQAVNFILQACVAIAEAHSLGIIHRDLKPANLFAIRRADGHYLVKVLDFGISKRVKSGHGLGPSGMSVTKTSAVMGSPLYMSPEQMQSAKLADAQSDIWALGVILYELLAGRVPFDGEAVTEVAIRVATQPPEPLRAHRPDLPPGLEAAALRCLEKDRRRRYRNVAELARALAEFAPRRDAALVERIAGTVQSALDVTAPSGPAPPLSVTASMTPVASAAVVQTAMPVSSSTRSTLPARSHRTGTIVALGLAAVALLSAAGLMVSRYVRARWDSGAVPEVVPALDSTSPSAPPPPPPATASSSPVPDPASTLMTLEPAAVDAGAVASSSKRAPLPPHHAPGQPSAAPPAPRPAPAGADCDPPFNFDDQGRKHFKPECYLKN